MELQVPENYEWPVCYEAEGIIIELLDDFLQNHEFTGRIALRMAHESSLRFVDWINHITVPYCEYLEEELLEAGFESNSNNFFPEFVHPLAMFPSILMLKTPNGLPDDSKPDIEVGIMVDNIIDFQLAHALTIDIEGSPYSSKRMISIDDGKRRLVICERRGCPRGSTGRAYDPIGATNYLTSVERWITRPRTDKTEEERKTSMEVAFARAKADVESGGEARAAASFLEGERRFWQARNTAGTIQKGRQDRLGLGWANADHHTFRSSRENFRDLIKLLEVLGFQKRERFYAGDEAGWGAQVMEQPEAGLVIFADVDLQSGEVDLDFSEIDLPPQDVGTIGLWCMLHGESILNAGMHHLEAQFSFNNLRNAMEEFKIESMKPFSDFDHLKQAFTKGEIWRVDPDRLQRAIDTGSLSKEAAELIEEQGAVGSHLENLQRRGGFKGFNQQSVSHIIKELNPEKQALGEDE